MPDSEPSWLTVTEIARRLARPDSTVRYWRNQYRTYLPELIGEGDSMRYPLGLFEEIDALIRRRAPPAEIRAVLAAHQGGAAPAATDSQAEVLAELRAIRGEIAEIRADVDRLSKYLLNRQDALVRADPQA